MNTGKGNKRLAAALAGGAAVLAGCTGAAQTPSATAPSIMSTTAATTVPSPSTSITATPPQSPVVAPVTAAELGATWRPECPVAPQQLRRVDLDYLGFDGQTHRGALVVHEQLVAQVVDVFDRLYRLRYPIAVMQTVEHYPGADDELSMQANNTSAFNCRGIPGSRNWSLHAYGKAIDLNPRLNPYIDRTGAFQPANAGTFVDRSRNAPGMLHAGDAAVRAFTDHGWRWGGYWRTPIDYQHFEWR
jgi:D-alanyl-D-alanine carboxypeptidase